MHEIVPGGFITNVATVQQQVDESLLEERLVSILASLFGGLALLLAAIGLYGIISFTVIRRTREIGIRMAVGAQRSAVIWLVLRKTVVLAAAGLALGIPLVFLARRYIESELYGLHGGDPVAMAGATLLLACVAIAAGFLAGVARQSSGSDGYLAAGIIRRKKFRVFANFRPLTTAT